MHMDCHLVEEVRCLQTETVKRYQNVTLYTHTHTTHKHTHYIVIYSNICGCIHVSYSSRGNKSYHYNSVLFIIHRTFYIHLSSIHITIYQALYEGNVFYSSAKEFYVTHNAAFVQADVFFMGPWFK